MPGILYVVYNDSIRDPQTNEMFYKIGITKNTVRKRFENILMPYQFKALFAYELEDYAKAETLIHGILKNYRKNGEWFSLTEKELNLIKANCEAMGGTLVTEEFEKYIDNKPVINNNDKNKNEKESGSNLNISNIVDRNILEKILERGIINVNDNICFHSTVDALNSLFGKTYQPGFAKWGKSVFWDKSNKKYIWFPNLNSNNGGWENTLHGDEDDLELYQRNTDPEHPNPSSDSKWDNADKAVFARRPNQEYRFIGIFKLLRHEGDTSKMKRISLELNLNEWKI